MRRVGAAGNQDWAGVAAGQQELDLAGGGGVVQQDQHPSAGGVGAAGRDSGVEVGGLVVAVDRLPVATSASTLSTMTGHSLHQATPTRPR